VSKGWPLVAMEDIFAIARGGSPRPIDSFLTDDPDGVNWVMISDATESGKYINSTKKRIREEGVKRSRVVQPGDFLLTNSMSFGRPYIMNISGCIHDGWLVLSPRNQNVSPDFFYHLLGSDFVYAEFVRRAAGVTVKNLNIDLVKGVQVPLPPMPEQRRIAEVLDWAAALRAKRRAALAQLDTLTQSIFLDLFGDPRTEGNRWPIVSLEEIVRETKLGLVRGSDQFGPNYKFPYVRMNAITRDGQLKLNDVQRTHATEAELELYRLEPGDFLFNTRNSEELVGKTALFRGDGVYLFNNNLMRVRFRDGVDSEFVAAAFKTPFIQHELSLRKSGTTNVFAIYYKDLRSLPVPVPPLQLQRDFARRVALVEKLKATHRASLAELDGLFAVLQHRAFRGEL
jgi:type I restriction enzyme, S subunit